MRPYGVMFHHFHGLAPGEPLRSHVAGQGAISAEEFAQMIERLGRNRILPAREWHDRAVRGSLRDDALCLTFDDNLRCQYDVALPVLREFGLTAFWFVYTSVNQGNLERLELYRQFRITRFDDVDAFYEAFFTAIDASPMAEQVRESLRDFKPSNHLADFPFYSDRDRTFRYVRDGVLGPPRYRQVMDAMMEAAGVDLQDLATGLWMDDGCLRELHAEGHVIGLHSHTHPTRLGELPPHEQRREYETNHAHLTAVLGKPPTAMSHPCNSYNAATLRTLDELGIRLGFRANMANETAPPFEWPREDHANILSQMRPADRARGPRPAAARVAAPTAGKAA